MSHEKYQRISEGIYEEINPTEFLFEKKTAAAFPTMTFPKKP